MKYFLVLLPFFLTACFNENQIRARVWKGGPNEITRDLQNGQEEFLLTSDPKFLDFRCMHKKDADALIRAALRNCKDPKTTRTR